MAAAGYFYAKAIVNAFTRAKAIDIDTNTLKAMLCTSGYVPNQDTHESKNDISNEVVGTGYTAGGATLTGKSFTNTNNVVTFTATIPPWTSSTITARYCVIYDDSGAGASDKALIGFIDFGQNESTTGGVGTFTVTFSATITVADAVGLP